jgi:predicted Zn finger-like uncharacterized protein
LNQYWFTSGGATGYTLRMYTYCPNCLAIYQVTSEHIDKAGGRTRCSECRQVYTAADYLFDDLAALRKSVEGQPATDSQPNEKPRRYAPLDIPAVRKDPGWDMSTEARPAVRPRPDSWQHRAVSMADIGSGMAVGLLVLLLGVQWVFFNRDVLAAEDLFQPAMERMCKVLHCTLPLQVDLAQFGIVERDVRKHPAVEDALLINVSFENRAEFAQPFPWFEVSFIDKAGNPVATRRFSPKEYLGKGVDIETGIPPQSPVQVVLEVVDPGEEAVSFQFGFL